MKKVLVIIALGAVAAGFILTPKFAFRNTGKAQNPGLTVGQVAPDFKLRNVDGRVLSLADVKDANGNAPNGYIVAFTCNTFPYSVMYEDRIIDLHQKFAPKGWPVVAIQPNDPDMKPGDDFAAMRVRASEKNFPFVYLIDEGQKVSPQYGATKTPHIFLLESNRKVRYIGAIDNNPQDGEEATRHYVAEAIAAIENGNEPNPNFTKAVGCGIKIK